MTTRNFFLLKRNNYQNKWHYPQLRLYFFLQKFFNFTLSLIVLNMLVNTIAIVLLLTCLSSFLKLKNQFVLSSLNSTA